MWLIVELFGLLCAAVLAGYSIRRLDVRPMIAGGTIGFCTWLLAGMFSESEEAYERLGLLTLEVRVVDSETGDAIQGATFYVVADDEPGTTTYRLPASAFSPADQASSEVVMVSLFVQRRISGSLYEQSCNPAAAGQLVDQKLEIAAPSYQPWRGTLHQLLPDGWPASAQPAKVIVSIER